MGILSRVVVAEIAASASLGAVLFIFVLFLQKAGQLFSILVNSSTTPATVGYLFLLLLPATMPLTLPLGVLVGTLIALSRMSSDGEITAMRASGIPARRLILPVAAFAAFAMGVTGFCSLWLTPWANEESIRVINRMGAAQLTAEIQPRVFNESFPNKVLYVGDVLPGQPTRWRPVFIADLTPPEQRQNTGTETGEGPTITVAGQAIVSVDPTRNRLQMSLLDGSSYQVGSDPQRYQTIHFPRGEQELSARERGEVKAKLYSATPTAELIDGLSTPEARIEFHQRLALPLACLLLALSGIPLGVSSRKGGKSAAFVITVFIAFLYYMTLVSLIGLAREGKILPEVAVWIPDALFAVFAVVVLSRLESPTDFDPIDSARNWAQHHWARLRGVLDSSPAAAARRSRLFVLPQLIDTFILSSFLFYFVVLLSSFVLLTEVFNFFELLGDVFKHNIAMPELIRYLVFLAPKLIYDAAPVSVLVAVLVTFGILAKNNEITAFKACGVSLHRLAAPVFVVCFMLSGAFFAFDHYVVTKANIIQEGLRNKIKGGPPQTYLNPNRKWFYGQGPWIYYYKLFEPEQGLLGGVSIYQFDQRGFELRRHLYAERARWEPSLSRWVFQDGWVRDLAAGAEQFRTFQGGTATFAEYSEPPSYFRKEVKTYKQMNFAQLDEYINELGQSGFNTIPLQVQFHKKFALPLFVFVMSLLSVPFAFFTGSRGAMAGVGVSLGVAIAYFVLNSLFEQLGSAGQMPAQMAAWAPDVIFALVGLYLLTRLRT